MSSRILNDEPALHDRLERSKFVAALADAAETCETPLVMGLYGTWGIGKTSLMRQIEADLQSRGTTYTVWFDPWQHQFDEDPAVALLHTMIDELGLGEEARKLLTVIASALGSMLLKATTTLSTSDIQEISDQYDEERFRVREKRIRLRDHFAELMRQATDDGEVRVVFFIDDLDRCAPEQVLRVLEALKLYLNMPGCAYVLAVDRAALEASIQQRYANIELSEADYLDKIVQLPFVIPPIQSTGVEEFIRDLLPEGLSGLAPMLAGSLGSNPRRVKRFINSLILNDRMASTMIGDDYRVEVLVAILAAQYRMPNAYKRLLQQPELFRDLIEDPEFTSEVTDEAALASIREVLTEVDLETVRPYLFLSEVASARRLLYDVIVHDVGEEKISVIKEVRGLTGLGLKEAKDLVESETPFTVMTGLDSAEAEAAAASIEQVGARVELV